MNKQAELTRWTPKRLLSLLMALIMTLSLLPTAALANDETQTLHLNNFKTASGSGESESVVDVAFGNIGTNGTSYRLSVHIDPKPDYAPGQKVDVRATADLLLEGGDQVDESHPLKVTVGNTAVTSEPNSSTSDSTSRTATDNSCTIGLDGSISFTTSIEYSVITSGSSEAITGSKTVPVKIKGLWTGYNITFTAPEGLTGVKFTGGIPEDGKAKTSFRDEEKGDFTPVYTIPASADAILDGYTFEGWTFRNLKTADGSVIGGTVAAGANYTYDFGSDATFTAELYKNQQITFDAGDYGGVTGILNKVQYSRGTKYDITVQDPKLDGYQFTGWLQEGTSYIYHKGGTVAGITSATKLIAQWTPDDGSAPVGSHKVTFLAGAADAYIPFANTTELVENGKDYTIPAGVPTREGYTFTGWKAGTTTYQPGNKIQNVTGDVTLEAQWARKQVRVVITKETDDVAVLPSTFTGTVGKAAHFSVIVPAKYDAAKMIVLAGTIHGEHKYLVPESQHIDDNGNITFYYQFTVTEGMFAQDPDTGAQTLPVAVGAVTEKTFNVTLPTGEQIDVDFTLPAAAVGSKSTTVKYDDSVTFTVAARPGYTVKGVYANGVEVNATNGSYTISKIQANQTVTVDVEAIRFHKVTYIVNDSTYYVQDVQHGGNSTVDAPKVEGYHFDGWYTGQDGTTQATLSNITTDTVVYAKLTPKNYTIQYDLNGGSDTIIPATIADQSKTHGTATKLSETVPTREGYTFLGWGTTADATAPSYQPGDMYSVDGDIELYAVWQQKTYTITFSSGEGYSLHNGHASMTVAHGANFDFNLIVDRDYAENEPKVWKNTDGVNSGKPLSNGTPTINQDGSKKYHYTLTNVTENIAINVDVRSNTIYTVTFMTNGSIYQTQQVGYNEKATRPVDPVVEGYTFGGWYKESTCDNAWNFVDVPATAGTTAILADTVTKDTTIYAKLTPIKPVITWKTPTATDGYTIEVKGTKAGTATTLTSPGTVDYGSTVTFTITISTGYDASKMQVGINNQLLAPKEINGDTYTFEFTAKQDTKITVVGVERKTVTIIYNANARDDVSGMPEAQTVKYYLDTATAVNDTIINQIPVRTGYKFLGWNKDSKAEAADSDYTVDKIKAGTTAKFTENTTLYAVWEADALTAELIITDEFTSAPSGTTISGSKLEYAYEGDSITLVGKLSADAQGTMTFYKKAKTATDWTFLGTTSINGGNYGVLGTTVENYKWGNADDTATKNNYRWEYKVEFKPTTDEGYSPCKASDDLRVYSKAISWEVDKKTDATTYNWTNAKNTLTIYTNEARTTTTDKMTANSTYWLQIPAVYELDGGLNLKNNNITKLSVGTHYEITWEYEDSANHWTTYATTSDTDWVKVTPEYSGYSFRAKVTPTQSSIYTKAATYDENGTVVKDVYCDYLITKATAKTEKQATTTELAITGADDEAAAVKINGASDVFTADHLAQFEGKKVTLTATVKDKTTNAGVKSGEVKFFRYVDGTSDELLNTTLISVDSNGVATYEVTISNWDTTQTAANNKDQFYAVYQPNATYDTSNSKTDLKAVYIKSTEIAQPVLKSDLPGKRNGTDANTTAGDNLTELLAGVQHTFFLVETGAQAKVEGVDGQFSVVAKDGRTVDAKNYTVEWLKTTGSNEQKLDVAENIKTVNVDDNKVGDKYRIKLIPQNDMKVGEVSNYAIIGKKQDVTVTVEASAEWVYQLNEITLTATVAAKETSSTMKPTGTVTFYYKDGSNWVKLGSAALAEDTNHNMTASITTKELPVDKTENIKRVVEITAVYEGNETFAVSGNYNETSKEVSAGNATNGVDDKTVTVYSSVVYVTDTVENKTTVVSNKAHGSGIYIYAEDDKVLANEGNVNLKLSEVYTLDHDIPLSKLTYNTDYTVQWQMLTNAAAYPDKASATWTNITSATGTTCQIDVEQGAAYRAVITVKDTPIAKGSFTEVQQAIPGHKVYYSNILVAANAPATLTVNVNTDNTSKGYEGIVEGETVTIHTFTSGATGTTPISQLTVNIYPGKPEAVAAAAAAGTPVTPVFTADKANVNGHVSFDWNKDVTPGYYTLKVKATFTNGYDDKEITRTLIVRDNDYSFNVTGDNAVYNGKVQGLNVAVQNMGIEDALAQKSVVVYYYDTDGKMVEPTQAGTYKAVVRLQESAYWTEKTLETTFTIKPREVSVVDLVAQAKVYDGTTNANIQEIILNDATVNSTTGLPTDDEGIIDGDSVYAVGTGYTDKATAGTAKLGVKDVSLKGDDAANYTLSASGYTEDFNIQRSQVKGAIVSGRTYKYTGKDIKLAASDIYLIDQAGNQLTNYEVTYYYHNGDGVEKVDAMNKMGKYTVIARPEQTNYKGGATETVYVGTTDNAGTLVTNAVSSLITISNTVELYGENKGIVATATNNATVTVEYQDGTGWSATRPTAAGRYLVKVTTSTGDTAYGLYTIVKARPEFTPTTNTASMEYTSGRYDGMVDAGFVSSKSDSTAETYITYTGGTIQGVAYEAPTEVGKYIATVHVGETANYTAHEKQVAFEITPKALTIKADSISRQQYGAYPDLTASFKGLATGGVAADTSLRDVQIQPELIFDTGYTNDADDQVGNNYGLTAAAALARNYNVSYQPGNLSVTREDPKEYLEIRGMIKNGDNATDLAYYGDVIQLYAYGNQSKTTTGDVHNTSSILAWSVGVGDPATITQDGLLTVKGVGDVTVTLKRGIGAQQISTSLTFEAKKQEVKVVVPDQDLVYNGAEQKYDGGKFYAENAKGERITATPYMHDGKVKRTNVGSQIITSWVGDTNATYQSEKYCGLFTINVKDVTVKPTAATVTYGDTLGTPGTLGYSENDTVGGVAALTDGKAVSERDAYINLDVLDGYEILVAGRENENYNVKYVTDQDAPDVEVTAKTLTISTGTLDKQTGMTSGSLNPMGKYPVNGAAIKDPAPAMGPSNVRMYGEPNWVMDETLATLISGDTLADLAALNGQLVSFNYNIGADANVSYTDKSTKLAVSGSTMPDYEVFTNASKMAFKNYNEIYTLGTQNIYQRPVTLSVPSGMTLTAYKPSILDSSNQVKNDVLLNLLLNNLIVSKYNNEGGLAELLKHTIKDLNIQIKSTQVTGDKLTVKIALDNQNYWLNSANEQTFEITLVTEKIVPKYSTLDWTSFSVTMYDAEGKAPVSVNGAVNFYIFKKKDGADLKYSDYKNDPIIRSGPMTPTGSTGQYVASFERLPAGEYAYFAIAQNYTIVE